VVWQGRAGDRSPLCRLLNWIGFSGVNGLKVCPLSLLF
jgi:hypothetical protein